jgi:hypothetical protein
MPDLAIRVKGALRGEGRGKNSGFYGRKCGFLGKNGVYFFENGLFLADLGVLWDAWYFFNFSIFQFFFFLPSFAYVSNSTIPNL